MDPSKKEGVGRRREREEGEERSGREGGERAGRESSREGKRVVVALVSFLLLPASQNTPSGKASLGLSLNIILQ